MKTVKLVLIAMLLMIAGCNQGSTTPSSTQYDYYQGTGGVEMEFMKGSPPDTVYVDTAVSASGYYKSDLMPIIVELKNKGPYDSWKAGSQSGTNVRLYSSGFDSSQVQGFNLNGDSVFLEARDENNPVGGYDTVEDEGSFVLPTSTTNYDLKLNVIACYDYGTLATGSVCIDPDPAHNENDVCTTHGASMGSQGAPVAVTSYTIDPMKDKVYVQINIAHIGSGEIIATDRMGNCPFNLEYRDKNVVKLEKVRIGSQTDSQAETNAATGCKPREVRLDSGNAVIHCTLDVTENDAAYTTTIQTELSYGYKDMMTKNIRIRKV